MRLRYDPLFRMKFRLLSDRAKSETPSVLELFLEDPLHPSLQNHPLRRPLSGRRALFVSEDLRIVFREKGDYTEVILLNIGTHTEVYR